MPSYPVAATAPILPAPVLPPPNGNASAIAVANLLQAQRTIAATQLEAARLASLQQPAPSVMNAAATNANANWIMYAIAAARQQHIRDTVAAQLAATRDRDTLQSSALANNEPSGASDGTGPVKKRRRKS